MLGERLIGLPAAVLVILVLAACGSPARQGQASPGSSAAPTGGAPAAASVSGHVSWPDCQSGCPPLGGTSVHFSDAEANQTLTATSDRSGAYSIALPPGTYTVIAGDADRSPYQKKITVRAGDRIALDLSIALPTG